MAGLKIKTTIVGVFLYSISVAGVIDGLDYQSESVATSSFVSSGMINPAGLAFRSSMGLRYSHSFTDSTFKGDDALMISSRRGFFGLEWLNHTTDLFRRKFTLAIGDRVSRNFYMGISYSWFNGNPLYKKVRSWKFGLLYHPLPIMALGFTADRINEPKFDTVRQKRLYRPGIAVRPFEKTITLSSDLRWIEGDDITELNGNLRMEVLPYSRFHLTAEYATEGTWRFGFTYDIEQTKSGGQLRLNRSQNYSGGSVFMELGALNYGSPLGSGRAGYIKLDRTIVEEPSAPSLFGTTRRPFYKIMLSLKKGAGDPAIKNLFINFDGARLSFASAQEIRSIIKEYRKNDKTVIVYLSSANNVSYYIASAADKIMMRPSGYLELRGIYATATFYTGAMEKLGIKAQVIKTGPHKTLGDAYTEKGFTDEAREQMNWLMDDLYEQFINDISAGRRITSTKTREIINNGPYTAKDAYLEGLLDKLIYFDDLMEEKVDGFSGLVDLYSHYDKNYYNPRWNEPQKIAIVYADGSIRSGASGRSLWEGKTAGSSTLSRALKRVRKDKNIKAVVLRVNSPGGDLFATDE
jgi:protease-4